MNQGVILEIFILAKVKIWKSWSQHSQTSNIFIFSQHILRNFKVVETLKSWNLFLRNRRYFIAAQIKSIELMKSLDVGDLFNPIKRQVQSNKLSEILKMLNRLNNIVIQKQSMQFFKRR